MKKEKTSKDISAASGMGIPTSNTFTAAQFKPPIVVSPYMSSNGFQIVGDLQGNTVMLLRSIKQLIVCKHESKPEFFASTVPGLAETMSNIKELPAREADKLKEDAEDQAKDNAKQWVRETFECIEDKDNPCLSETKCAKIPAATYDDPTIVGKTTITPILMGYDRFGRVIYKHIARAKANINGYVWCPCMPI